jgi:predicted phosphate transport protein (TIGR00153 family)
MRARRAESKVMALIEEHLEKVEESLQSMLATIDAYLQGEIDSAESHASRTHRAESEADAIRRGISDLLHRGAFLPVFREDVIELVRMVDEIAGHAQTCCKFIINQRPDVPDNLRQDFLKVARDSIASLPPLQEGVTKLSEDLSITREKAAQVHGIEKALDELEWQLSHRIFSTDLPLAHKMHLKQLVDVIVGISDIAEDAAEILETLIVKKQT